MEAMQRVALTLHLPPPAAPRASGGYTAAFRSLSRVSFEEIVKRMAIVHCESAHSDRTLRGHMQGHQDAFEARLRACLLHLDHFHEERRTCGT